LRFLVRIMSQATEREAARLARSKLATRDTLRLLQVMRSRPGPLPPRPRPARAARHADAGGSGDGGGGEEETASSGERKAAVEDGEGETKHADPLVALLSRSAAHAVAARELALSHTQQAAAELVAEFERARAVETQRLAAFVAQTQREFEQQMLALRQRVMADAEHVAARLEAEVARAHRCYEDNLRSVAETLAQRMLASATSPEQSTFLLPLRASAASAGAASLGQSLHVEHLERTAEPPNPPPLLPAAAAAAAAAASSAESAIAARARALVAEHDSPPRRAPAQTRAPVSPALASRLAALSRELLDSEDEADASDPRRPRAVAARPGAKPPATASASVAARSAAQVSESFRRRVLALERGRAHTAAD
jgi:hypothetical protein